MLEHCRNTTGTIHQHIARRTFWVPSWGKVAYCHTMPKGGQGTLYHLTPVFGPHLRWRWPQQTWLVILGKARSWRPTPFGVRLPKNYRRKPKKRQEAYPLEASLQSKGAALPSSAPPSPQAEESQRVSPFMGLHDEVYGGLSLAPSPLVLPAHVTSLRGPLQTT